MPSTINLKLTPCALSMFWCLCACFSQGWREDSSKIEVFHENIRMGNHSTVKASFIIAPRRNWGLSVPFELPFAPIHFCSSNVFNLMSALTTRALFAKSFSLSGHVCCIFKKKKKVLLWWEALLTSVYEGDCVNKVWLDWDHRQHWQMETCSCPNVMVQSCFASSKAKKYKQIQNWSGCSIMTRLYTMAYSTRLDSQSCKNWSTYSSTWENNCFGCLAIYTLSYYDRAGQ